MVDHLSCIYNVHVWKSSCPLDDKLNFFLDCEVCGCLFWDASVVVDKSLLMGVVCGIVMLQSQVYVHTVTTVI